MKAKKFDLIPAAGYLRMSSDKQDTSIDDQRQELIAYAAKHGFVIVKWYIDEGISGWKSKQRQSFLNLITDAAAGEFKVILCWDQSRFSRFDPMEANFYWHQLRQAGVHIETVKEGRLDFESLGGWLTASVQQHGKAEYCRSLAADTVRGRRKLFTDGKWITCRPYGYNLVKKIDGGDGKLILGDEREVEVVRRIFQMRVRGMGARLICKVLNTENVPAPRSGMWYPRQINSMLKRQTYIGHTSIGLTRTGKFVPFGDSLQVKENTHPAIIGRELWEAAQAVCINSKNRTRRAGMKYREKAGHLAGLLKCGCCGRPMFSDNWRKGYICATYHSGGGCSHNTIAFDVALKAVADKIRDDVLAGSVEALTAKIEKVLAKRTAAPRVDADAINRQIAEIDRKLEAAATRILEVEASLFGDVQSAMLGLKDKRAALVARLSTQTPASKPRLTAGAIAAKLWELDGLLKRGDAGTVREALTRLIDRVQIDYRVKQHGKLRRSTVTGGTVFFKGANGDACSTAKRSLRSLPDVLHEMDRSGSRNGKQQDKYQEGASLVSPAVPTRKSRNGSSALSPKWPPSEEGQAH